MAEALTQLDLGDRASADVQVGMPCPVVVLPRGADVGEESSTATAAVEE